MILLLLIFLSRQRNAVMLPISFFFHVYLLFLQILLVKMQIEICVIDVPWLSVSIAEAFKVTILITFSQKMFWLDICWIFTARKRSLRRLCFYTCLSVHRGGVPGQVSPRQVHPWVGTHPPWAGALPWQVHSPGRYTPWAGTPPMGRYTPPAGTPDGQVHHPGALHAGRYGQQASGTHPTGMHSC